jgi:hypothetical protein
MAGSETAAIAWNTAVPGAAAVNERPAEAPGRARLSSRSDAATNTTDPVSMYRDAPVVGATAAVTMVITAAIGITAV